MANSDKMANCSPLFNSLYGRSSSVVVLQTGRQSPATVQIKELPPLIRTRQVPPSRFFTQGMKHRSAICHVIASFNQNKLVNFFYEIRAINMHFFYFILLFCRSSTSSKCSNPISLQFYSFQ